VGRRRGQLSFFLLVLSSHDYLLLPEVEAHLEHVLGIRRHLLQQVYQERLGLLVLLEESNEERLMGDPFQDPDVGRATARLGHEVHRLDELGQIPGAKVALK